MKWIKINFISKKFEWKENIYEAPVSIEYQIKRLRKKRISCFIWLDSSGIRFNLR